MDFDLSQIIDGYKVLAVQYSVSPMIFGAIYIVMTPLYYYGAYRLAKVGVVYRRSCKKRRIKPNLHALFKQKGFVNGYVLNRVSWAAPYGYVIMWGNNLPKKFYILILLWLGIGCYIFYHSLEKKIIKK